MRYLLVSRQHHPQHGGVGAYVQRFLRAAANTSDWRVECVSQPGDQWPPCARVHEVRTPDMGESFGARLNGLRRQHLVRPYRYALWAKAVAERLLRIDGEFDAIEFVDCQAEGIAAIGCPALRRRFANAAWIVHAHTPMYVEDLINAADMAAFGRPLYHRWERQALEQADGVIVTSHALALDMKGTAPTSVIPYPIDENTSVSRGPRAERVLLIGTVQPRKGVDVWARSLNQVLRERPRAQAMLIGPDTPTAPDGLSMAAHVQHLLDRRVLDRFAWAGGLPHERVQSLIAESSLVVVPSRLESFSLVAAESLLAGTPVIVSDQTGLAEHVPSLPQVRCDDADAWAVAQCKALAGSASAHAVALRCRAEMLEVCEPRRVLVKREGMIEVIKGRRSQAPAGGEDMLAALSDFIASVDSRVPSCEQPLSSVRS